MKAVKVTAKAAKNYYYEKDPIFNADGKGENIEYGGKLAEVLGLKEGQKVDKETFERLLEGKDPFSGAELVSSGGNDKRVAVVDMPFAAPKSVSHAALVLGDERVVHAHQKAVESALKYIEENVIQTREYKKDENGELIKDDEGKYVRERVNTHNMLVAKVQHSTARPVPGEAEDPHLHTHALIFNITYNENEDKFKAVEFLELFKQQSKIDKIYKSELAKNLKELGYAIESKGNGKFEIAGYSEDVLNNFSKRHMQIEQAKKELKNDVNFKNLSEEKLDVVAQHTSKSDKSNLTGEELKQEWKAQHEYKGITSLEELQKNIKEAAKKQEEFKYSAKEVLELSAKILTQNESTFSRDELLKQAADLSLGNYSIEDLEEELNKVKKTGQKHGYEIKKLDDKNFTTKEMYDIEKENIKIIKNQKTFKRLMDSNSAEKLIEDYEKEKGFNLTEEQRDAVTGILTSNEQFIAIQGSAGVGKTTLLDALRESLEKEGKEIDIQVLTPTGKAASEAIKASGIQSKTIDSFLLSLEKKSKKENEYIAKNEDGLVEITNKYINKKFEQLEQQNGVHAQQKNDNSFLPVEEKEQQQNYNKDDFSLKRTNIRRLDSKYYVKAEDFKNRTPFGFLSRFRNTYFIGNNFTGYKQIDFKKGYKDNAIGVKRVEYRSFKGDTFSYKSVSKFKDGTKIEYKFEEFSPIRFKILGKNIALSSVLGYKTHTNSILTADKERLYSKNTKGSVLGLLNYEQKTQQDKYTKQSRHKLSVAAILSLSYNSKTAQTKTGGKYKRRALEFNILGFKITKESLKITDKKGNVLKHITHTKKTFLGKEISNNLVDKTKETGLIKNLTKNLLVNTNYTKDVYNNQNKVLQKKIKDIKHNSIELDKRLKTTKITNDVSKKLEEEQKQVQKVLIVDETSLLDARKANRLLKYAKENNIKVIFMGDSKQLKSIGAGNFFEDLKRNTKVLKVDESVRQRNNKAMKEIVDTIAKEKDVSKGLDMLDKLNKVKEFKVEIEAKNFKNIDQYKQAYEAARQESLEKMTTEAAKEIAKDVKNTLAVAATREIVSKINRKVKASLNLKENENTFSIKVIKNLSPSSKMVAGNYEPGKDVIIPNKNIKTLEKFKEYEIAGIDEINNKIVVKDKDNNEVKIDLKENGLDLQIYTKETQNFARGDKVVFLQNNRDLGIFNGELGYIKEYDKERHILKVEKENGDVVEFNPKFYDKFDLGYAITAHKSQGTTSKKVVAVLDTKYKDMNTFNLAYVALSRHKEDVQVFTTNKQELKEQVQKEQQKRSTLDYTQEDFDKEALIEDLKDFENLTKTQEEKAFEIAKAFANANSEQKQQLQQLDNKNKNGVHAQQNNKIENEENQQQKQIASR